MTKSYRKIALLLLLTTLVVSAQRRDPLTPAETDQLREVAIEPAKRLKLLIKFADARLAVIEQIRSDPKSSEGRGKRIHDLLEDFTALLDEINDNLDMYQARPLTKDDRKDFRKGLKALVEAGDSFDLKLKTLKAAAESDPQTKLEASEFKFVLRDADEALKSSIDLAREYTKDKNPDPKVKP